MCQLEGLAEFSGRGQVRTTAQVDEVALAVQGKWPVRRDRLDYLGFVFFADSAEEGGSFISIPNLTTDGLIAVDDFLHACFDYLQVFFGECFLAREVVVKAILDGRPNRYLRLRPQLLNGLGQNVCGVVTQQLDAVVRVTGDDFHGHVGLDVATQIPEFAIDANSHSGFRESFANTFGNLCTAGWRGELPVGAVG